MEDSVPINVQLRGYDELGYDSSSQQASTSAGGHSSGTIDDALPVNRWTPALTKLISLKYISNLTELFECVAALPFQRYSFVVIEDMSLLVDAYKASTELYANLILKLSHHIKEASTCMEDEWLKRQCGETSSGGSGGVPRGHINSNERFRRFNDIATLPRVLITENARQLENPAFVQMLAPHFKSVFLLRTTPSHAPDSMHAKSLVLLPRAFNFVPSDECIEVIRLVRLAERNVGSSAHEDLDKKVIECFL